MFAYPVRTGNALRPLVDGERAFRRIGEAIDAAQHSVWATVTFMWSTFQMPDGRGSALDLLTRVAARGVDVRVIFWRPDPETEFLKSNAFWGSTEHLQQLEASRSGIRVRWDRAQPGFCQHQKSWLIDAGTTPELAFVGGINLNPHSVVAPGHHGHHGDQQNHDLYLELAGPSIVDVHHNFVQRWNGASERHAANGRWGPGSDTDLLFPAGIPEERGQVTVQIQRTMHSGRYRDVPATPAGVDFDAAAGERSNFDQCCAAISTARRWIYLEHQHIEVPEIIDCLRDALERGVEIVAVLPASGEQLERLRALGAFPNFTLAGLAGLGTDGERTPVWIHSKLMIVDGEWGTAGSCNLHRYSLFGNSELNAAFWDRPTAHALLCELLHEHLDLDTSGMDGLAALRQFRTIALNNARLFREGDVAWQGIAFSLLS